MLQSAIVVSLLCFANAIPGRHRRGADAPIARSLRADVHEVRRRPPAFLSAMGPLAVGKRDGDDAKMALPGIGTFGVGDVKSSVAKFIPAGMNDEVPNGGTFDLGDKPNLGYMDRETTAGKTSGSSSKMSLGGIGTFHVGQEKEQGTGLLDFSKALFPFLELPTLKNQDEPDEHTAVDRSLADVYYPKPKSYVEEAERQLESNPPPPRTPFTKLEEASTIFEKETPKSSGNPFDRILTRAGFPDRLRVHAAKIHTEDADLLPAKETTFDEESDEGFIKQTGKEKSTEQLSSIGSVETLAAATGRVPLTRLGLSQKEIYALCAKFSVVAAKHCYGPKVEEQYLEKCRGYNEDCKQFQAQARPLGAIANAFSSGVGLTYYNWDVNGIPYYAVNEEGSIGNGHNGKVDFGTWGGGYSDNLGVRDFYSQTQEYGANWYEGTYGYKTGWSIPIVQSAGVEGGGGTQVSVPLKEGEIGKPIYATSGYHVGPYFGVADRVGVDWYNGGVSYNRGVASPFVGIGVNSGTSIGFPSIGTIMNRMGVQDMTQLSQIVAAQGTTTSGLGGIGAGSSSAVAGAIGV
ncbi:hypothetical protein Q1695_010868 [Nippostrongylus brasiliensis]|nr:hypothetical protein Q1695_010868 [Nippostrongylus brasiliensis]